MQAFDDAQTAGGNSLRLDEVLVLERNRRMRAGQKALTYKKRWRWQRRRGNEPHVQRGCTQVSDITQGPLCEQDVGLPRRTDVSEYVLLDACVISVKSCINGVAAHAQEQDGPKFALASLYQKGKALNSSMMPLGKKL